MHRDEAQAILGQAAMSLSEYMDAAGDTGDRYPGVEQAAQHAGLDPRIFAAALEDLVECGWLIRYPRQEDHPRPERFLTTLPKDVAEDLDDAGALS